MTTATTTTEAEATDDTKTEATEDSSLLTTETETTEETTGDKETETTDATETEQKSLLTDEDKTEETTDEESEESEKSPEAYEAFTAPEGVTLDEKMLEEFSTAAREANMPQEKAQQFIDMAVKVMQQQAEAQEAGWAEIRAGWVTEIKADKDFGGDKFNATIEGAQRVLNTYGTSELKAALGFGMGDNPELIKMLSRIDQATREDSTAGDSGGGESETNERPTLANTLYADGGKKTRR